MKQGEDLHVLYQSSRKINGFFTITCLDCTLSQRNTAEFMSEPSYIGIDSNEHNEWVAALWVDGKIILSRPFKNTSPEIGALVRFITEHCTRPRICLKPASPTTLKLIKFIGGIPDVEVVLLSDAGLQMHQAWLPKGAAKTAARGNCQAQLLACCAERII